MRAVAENLRPYGRRVPLPETHAIREESRAGLGGRVERKTLLAAASWAGRALRLPCSARTLLSVLAACYGEQQLSKGLLVWPSNAYLIDKTGLPERTLRGAILRLRQEGLIIAVDSPNGKRYARRQGNSVTQAYGFDLAPLHARRDALTAAVAALDAERALVRSLRNDLSAVFKDLEDLVAAFADQDREDIAISFMGDLTDARPPRSLRMSSSELAKLLERAELGRMRAERTLYEVSRTRSSAASGGENRRHKESNTDFSAESCQHRHGANAPQTPPSRAASGGTFWAFDQKKGQGVRFSERGGATDSEAWREDHAPLLPPMGEALMDVALWRGACPALVEFFGPIATIEDVNRAGVCAMRMLQVAPHGIEQWQRQLGPLFALTAAYVFQLHSDDQVKGRPEIRKIGGFFCYVAREVAEGVRDLPLELMALRRKRKRPSSVS